MLQNHTSPISHHKLHARANIVGDEGDKFAKNGNELAHPTSPAHPKNHMHLPILHHTSR